MDSSGEIVTNVNEFTFFALLTKLATSSEILTITLLLNLSFAEMSPSLALRKNYVKQSFYRTLPVRFKGTLA
jgi:hypothetical protein